MDPDFIATLGNVGAKIAFAIVDNITPALEKMDAALARLEALLIEQAKREARRASAVGELHKLLRLAQHRRTKKHVARLVRESDRTRKRALGSHNRFALENA